MSRWTRASAKTLAHRRGRRTSTYLWRVSFLALPRHSLWRLSPLFAPSQPLGLLTILIAVPVSVNVFRHAENVKS